MPVRLRFSVPAQTGSGYRISFPGVKRPRHGINHPLPSSAEVKERVELYLYSPSGTSWPLLRLTLPFTLINWGGRYAIAQLGEELREKPEGRMFDSRWGL